MIFRSLVPLLFALLLPAMALAATKHVVKSGDNLYDLSRKYGVSVKDLKAANNLDNNRLDIGDELMIPASGSSVSSNKTSNNTYTIKSGDTLSEIAEKHGISTASLKKANKLKSNKLKIGQKLLIPSADKSVQKPKNTSESAKLRVKKEETKTPGKKETVSKEVSTPGTYTVQSGDTLGHIAVKYDITSKQIRVANGLKNNKLSIGQVLAIPPKESTTKTVAKETQEQLKATTETKPEKPQTTTTAVQEKPKTQPNIYVVKKGDTLGHIAERLGVSTKDLGNTNNLKNDKLQIGQGLKVPGAKTVKAETVREDVESTTTVAKTSAKTQRTKQVEKTPEKKSPAPAKYTVKKGDTLSQIAEKLSVSTKDLKSTNNLSTNKLQIGQKLKVPGVKAAETNSELSETTAETPVNTEEIKQAAEAPEKKTPSPAKYTVKKGDNLYDISKKYKVSVKDIKKWNNLKNNNLSIDQELTLSSSEVTAQDSNAVQPTESAKAAKQDTKKKTTTEKPSKPEKSYIYTVKKGDTLGHIALKNGVTVKQIKMASGLKSDKLRLGQTLKIPGTEKETLKAQETKTTTEKPQPVSGKEVYIKKRYIVKGGDSLSKIASNFGVTVRDIKKASSLKSDRINKGDILLIPVPHQRVTISHHKVVRGDTLGKIARNYGVSVKELKRANGLRSDNINLGKKLVIPGNSAPVVTGSPNTYAKTKSSSYIVKRGDTLGLIARRHGTSLYTLRDANNIKGNTLWAGQTLIIPNSVNGYDSSDDSESYSAYNSKYFSDSSLSQDSIINVAKKYLGAPYKFGGNSFTTGIDCSGYVKKVFSSFNVTLPRTARDIFYKSGHQVSKKKLDTGDLVFFQTYAKYPSHVGIYIGNGNNEFIHASSASRMVTIDTMNKRYYRQRYLGAKRINLKNASY